MPPMPKPNAVTRHKPMQWTDLPADGRKGAPPKLPPLRTWQRETLDRWAYWWSTPQAVAWDQSGSTLIPWAVLYDRIVTEPDAPVALFSALRAIEADHAFSPAAMAKLRWRVVADEVAPKRVTRKKVAANPLTDRLRAV